MRGEAASIHQSGAELVVVGNGTEHFARAFREDLALDTPLYVDPACASYRSMGMKRGVMRTLGSWRTWRRMGRAVRKSIVERRIGLTLRWWGSSIPALATRARGDAWQLGGVLVVLPNGDVPYRYLSAIAGDHPPIDAILGALAASVRK